MDAPNDREAPGTIPEDFHGGLARQMWARARSCVDTRNNAVHPEPARAPVWLPAARWVPLGPLGKAPPLVDLALAVSASAGAHGALGAPKCPQTQFFAFYDDPCGLVQWFWAF